MKKYKIDLVAEGKEGVEVWVNETLSGVRYRLPVKGYIESYKRKGWLASTDVGWGYAGTAPLFLANVLADELLDGGASKDQHEEILFKVQSSEKGDASFLFEC